MATDNITDNEKAENSSPETTTANTAEESTGADTNATANEVPSDNGLQAKVDELNDRYLRLYSEFDNYRKRTARERIELIKTAGEDILKSFLPVIDDLERGIKMNETSTDIKAINEGFQLIYNKFKNTLTQKGIEAMESVGKEFNADIHEAITNIPAPSEDLKGKVVEEIEKGYSLNGKVIRFAKVIVGN